MSLINQMLKDLDKRKNKRDNASLNDINGLYSVSERRRFFRFYPLLSMMVSLVLLIIMSIYLYHLLSASPTHKSVTKKAQVSHHPNVQATVKKVSHKSPKPQLQQTTVSKTFVPLSVKQQSQLNLQRSMQLANMGANAQAIVLLRKTLALNNQDKAARQLLATIYYQEGNTAQAQTILQFGLKQAPHYSPYAELLAHIYLEQGNMTKAMATLQQAVPDLMTNPGYFAFMATLRNRLHQPKIAIELYQQILKIKPDNAVWWLGLGVSYLQAKQPSAAKIAFRHAEQLGGLTPQLTEFVNQQLAELEG